MKIGERYMYEYKRSCRVLSSCCDPLSDYHQEATADHETLNESFHFLRVRVHALVFDEREMQHEGIEHLQCNQDLYEEAAELFLIEPEGQAAKDEGGQAIGKHHHPGERGSDTPMYHSLKGKDALEAEGYRGVVVVPLCLHVMKLCVEVKRLFLVEIHGAESLTD